MTNPVKQKMKAGNAAIGHWLSLPSPGVAELMASFGMDWLLIDTEHGPTDYETVENMIRGMKGTDVVPLVRVAANDTALIKKALDRGAFGVIVPLVNTADEARAAVAACKYPPAGIRGIAGSRVNRYGLDLKQYFAEWNDNVLVVVQIETQEALENIEEIAAVPGVDVLFIGPNDLSGSLGVFQQFDNPTFKAAVNRIVDAGKKNEVAVGYMASGPESTLEKVDEGFLFIAVGTDARLLGGAAQDTYAKIEQGLSRHKR